MMKDRDVPVEASDAVIWATTFLLAVVIGAGVTFGTWAFLHAGSDPRLPAALIVAAAGLSLIAISFLRVRLARMFLLTVAVSMVFGYVIGPLGFWR